MNRILGIVFFAAISCLIAPTPASACGGFFCSNLLQPVDQTKERILFRVNGDGTVTTFVEISYLGDPDQFAWIIPTPTALDTADIDITGPELFDELEEVTRPRFEFLGLSEADSMGVADGCAWCGPRCRAEQRQQQRWIEDNVEVLDTLAIGPFDLEVIEAQDAQAFNMWLAQNNYATTATADELLEHYIDAGMAFLGVKLIPEEVSGPLDTLVFSYPADDPMIPIILTSIAAMPDMEILTYVLADEPYRSANYEEMDFDYQRVEPLPEVGTNYTDLLPAAVDEAGGQAFLTEFAGPTASLATAGSTAAEVLATGAYLTRMRTYLSAEEMTVDPMFTAAPEAPDVSNVHQVALASAVLPERSPERMVGFALLPLLLLGLRRRL